MCIRDRCRTNPVRLFFGRIVTNGRTPEYTVEKHLSCLTVIKGGFAMNQHHSLPESCANTVPIKVNRVFDSCSDRDCFSNIQILMDGGALPENITMVKSRCVRVSDICMNIEPVPFNRGFYSIDLTYTFRIEFMAYERACSLSLIHISEPTRPY